MDNGLISFSFNNLFKNIQHYYVTVSLHYVSVGSASHLTSKYKTALSLNILSLTTRFAAIMALNMDMDEKSHSVSESCRSCNNTIMQLNYRRPVAFVFIGLLIFIYLSLLFYFSKLKIIIRHFIIKH